MASTGDGLSNDIFSILYYLNLFLPTKEMVSRIQAMEDFYICSYCNTIRKRDRYIKPNIVLFGDTGDWFSIEGLNKIIQLIDQADCILVLGTSLKVTPFSTFPQYRRKGVPIIIINKGDTPYDHAEGAYIIQDFIGKTLSQIDRNLSKTKDAPPF